MLTVLVEDKTGHVVTSDSSLVSLKLAGTAGAVLKGTAAVQAAGGVATFSGLSPTKAGTYTLAATDGALRGAKSRSFKIEPDGSTAHFSLSQVLPNTISATKPLPPIIATLEDQFGNIIKNNKTAVTLAIVSGPAGGALKGEAQHAFHQRRGDIENISTLSPAGRLYAQIVRHRSARERQLAIDPEYHPDLRLSRSVRSAIYAKR